VSFVACPARSAVHVGRDVLADVVKTAGIDQGAIRGIHCKLVEPMLTDVEAWFAELDRLTAEPFMAAGRQQPDTPKKDVFDEDVCSRRFPQLAHQCGLT
jgi:hypothetical protein